jgi:hypothetical protein
MQALQMFIFIMPLLMVKDARGFGAPEFDLSRNNMCHQISNAMGQVQKIDRQRIRNELHRFSGRAGTNKKLLMWIRHGFDLPEFLRDRLYSEFGFTCEEDLIKAVAEAGGDYKKLFNIDPSTINLRQHRRMSKADFNKKWAPIIENLKGVCKASRDIGDPEANDVDDAGFDEPVANTDTDESPLTPTFSPGFTTKEDAGRDSKASCDSQVPLDEQDEAQEARRTERKRVRNALERRSSSSGGSSSSSGSSSRPTIIECISCRCQAIVGAACLICGEINDATKAPTRSDVVDLAASGSDTDQFDSDTGEDIEIGKHTGKGKGPARKKRRREDLFNAKKNWSSEDDADLAQQLHDEWNRDSPPINLTGDKKLDNVASKQRQGGTRPRQHETLLCVCCTRWSLQAAGRSLWQRQRPYDQERQEGGRSDESNTARWQEVWIDCARSIFPYGGKGDTRACRGHRSP